MKLYSYLAREEGREQVGDRLTRFIALDLATFYLAESPITLASYDSSPPPSPRSDRYGPERDERSTRNSWGKLEIFPCAREQVPDRFPHSFPEVEWKKGGRKRGGRGVG